MDFFKGQRWMSEAEPELGLGLVLEVDLRTVKLLFPAGGEMRMYSRENAPVKRVQFQEGDRVETHDGAAGAVEAWEERDGVIFYKLAEREVPEMELADTIQMGTADRRLLDGRVDPGWLFDLRLRALEERCRIQKHPAHGFVGARMDLLSHQLSIAQEVASRLAPRVLLADEVGLGKTIEAGLILHRLQVRGRCGRVMVLVPDALIHQWFVELLRRFNLSFSIFDEERCVNMEGVEGGGNPFEQEHFILTNLSLFKENPERLRQALDVDWGLLIVDEAHHLHWSEDAPSPEYQMVEVLAGKASGLLLLTATPEQFGESGHFGRLRLLDPARFSDLEAFLKEAETYQKTAKVIDKLILNTSLTKRERSALEKLFEKDDRNKLDAIGQDGAAAESDREALVVDLLDRHGPGRVVFRNTRNAIQGFPKRKVHAGGVGVPPAGEDDWGAILRQELAFELGRIEKLPKANWKKDPRVDWLVRLIKRLKGEKVLLICRYRERAEALHEAVAQKINIKMTVFHEKLTLIQRDRNAAYFSEPEGAQLLICSEIGSEGRNFQFAHHLVLYDLPLDPELLEQRIGRLDRIGQREQIHLHVPFFKGTGGELLFEWYAKGVGSFDGPVQSGAMFTEVFGERLRDLIGRERMEKKDWSGLLEETAVFGADLKKKLESGRDRLLELQSNKVEKTAELIGHLRGLDEERTLEKFLLDAFDHFGVNVEMMEGRRWLLTRGHHLAEEFSMIPSEGKMVTLDRKLALDRDDVEFLTWDHPMVFGVFDLLLSSENGNASFSDLSSDAVPPGLYAEIVYVLEGVCAARFDLKRFLPTTAIHLVFDAKGAEVTTEFVPLLQVSELADAPAHFLRGSGEVLQGMLRDLQESAMERAEEEATQLRGGAMGRMEELFERELKRLERLKKQGGLVRDDELSGMHEEKDALADSIEGSQLRLDAMRLIRVTGD